MVRRLAPVLAAMAVAGLAACASALPARKPVGPTLAQSIEEQVARNEAIPWTLRRPLTWADFKAAPPSGGATVAQTAYNVFHGARCTGSTFQFRVVAAFRPKDSWVRPAIVRSPVDGIRALRHEQTHFDLAEVHARRMRRYFAELIAPCRSSVDELAEMAERFIRDEKAAQAQYDSETDHSRAVARQTAWDRDVSQQLLGLSRYVK